MLRTYLYILAFSFVLNGCKQASTSSSPSSSTAGVSKKNISGVVQLGRVRGATVRAIEVNQKGVEGRIVAETKTNNSGEFTLEIPTSSSIVTIKSSGGLYSDESTNQTINAPEVTNTLNILETSVAPVTPLTTLVSERLKERLKNQEGQFSSLLTSSKREVSQNFGIEMEALEVIPAPPENQSNQTSVQINAALSLAALSEFVARNHPGKTIDEVMGSLRQDIKTDGLINGTLSSSWDDKLVEAAREISKNSRLGFRNSVLTVDLSSSVSSRVVREPILVEAVFNRAVNDFTLSDITTTNAITSSFEGGGTRYSFYIIPTSQGPFSLQIKSNRAQDSGGVKNAPSNILVFQYDSLPPANPSLTINDNDDYSPLSVGNLSLFASGSPIEMYITEMVDCGSGGYWEDYTTKKTASPLNFVNGVATIYVKFRDAAGNESSCVSDSILYQSPSPPPSQSGGQSILNSLFVKRWPDGSVSKSCTDYRNPPMNFDYTAFDQDGLYQVDPDLNGPIAPFIVYCDMSAEGWALIYSSTSECASIGEVEVVTPEICGHLSFAKVQQLAQATSLIRYRRGPSSISYNEQIESDLSSLQSFSIEASFGYESRWLSRVVQGCTNPAASNYNSLSNIDNETCNYGSCAP